MKSAPIKERIRAHGREHFVLINRLTPVLDIMVRVFPPMVTGMTSDPWTIERFLVKGDIVELHAKRRAVTRDIRPGHEKWDRVSYTVPAEVIDQNRVEEYARQLLAKTQPDIDLSAFGLPEENDHDED